jgi:hypothetical protein
MTTTPTVKQVKKEIPLSPAGALHLAVTPLSWFTLTSAEYPLDQEKNPLKLEGSCSQIPNNTTCEILFARKQDPNVPKPSLERLADDAVSMKGLMRVSGSTFQVLKANGSRPTDIIELHVLKHELVGKGELEVTIAPDLPGCNVGLDTPTRTFPYDNQVCFTHTADQPVTIGTRCSFAPTVRTGAFANVATGVEIEEYDDPASSEGRDQEAAGKDLHKTMRWEANDSGEQYWWVGCEAPADDEGETPAKVRLVYPEPEEIPPFEFTRYIHAELNGDWHRLSYPPDAFAAAVQQPGIEALTLDLVDKEPLSGSEAEAVEGSPDPVSTPARKQVRVEVRLSNFAPDILFPISLRFWRAVDGDPTKIEPAGVPDIEEPYRTGSESRLFFKDTTLPDLKNCFVVLGFPGVAGMGATGTHVPITAILHVEAPLRPGIGNLAFEEPEPGKGRLADPRSSPAASTGVASSQANAVLKLKDETGVH